MKTLNKYVGLDVHKDTTVMAVAEGQRAFLRGLAATGGDALARLT